MYMYAHVHVHDHVRTYVVHVFIAHEHASMALLCKVEHFIRLSFDLSHRWLIFIAFHHISRQEFFYVSEIALDR